MRKVIVLLKTLLMAACAVALFGVITWQLRRLDPLVPVTLPPWLAVAGVLLVAAGALLALASFWTFTAGGALSPHAHFPDPEGLITWEPFRYARNPMTKGAWTVLCG
jgi:protein-S-isoprenylcysteine O-methyltransferase Ste14